MVLGLAVSVVAQPVDLFLTDYMGPQAGNAVVQWGGAADDNGGAAGDAGRV
jgi:hypothetical protein